MIKVYKDVELTSLTHFLNFLHQYQRPEVIKWDPERMHCKVCKVDVIQLRSITCTRESDLHHHVIPLYEVHLELVETLTTLNCRCAYDVDPQSTVILKPGESVIMGKRDLTNVNGHENMRLDTFEVLPEMVDHVQIDPILAMLTTEIPLSPQIMNTIEGYLGQPSDIQG